METNTIIRGFVTVNDVFLLEQRQTVHRNDHIHRGDSLLNNLKKKEKFITVILTG